jgi:hypothetical protein
MNGVSLNGHCGNLKKLDRHPNVWQSLACHLSILRFLFPFCLPPVMVTSYDKSRGHLCLIEVFPCGISFSEGYVNLVLRISRRREVNKHYPALVYVFWSTNQRNTNLGS